MRRGGDSKEEPKEEKKEEKKESDQLEYTAPTEFRFIDEPMFCFSTLNANTNPNPNCRPGHPTLAANTVYSQGRCPGRLYHGVSGQGRVPRPTVRVRVRVSI